MKTFEALSKARSSGRESAPFSKKLERTHVRCYSFNGGSFMSRILVLSSVVGLLFLTADTGRGAASKPSSPKRPDKIQKRSNNSSKRSDSSSKGADSTPPPAVKGIEGYDLASFKIITDRNIFNSNRSSRSRGDEKKPGSKVESFALTGTLTYEKGTFAFFDGSSAEYRKVLKPEGKIAGYQITEIGPDAAKLDTGEQKVEMRVGMQMRREDGGEWKLSAAPAPPPSSSSSSSSSRFGSSSSSNSRFSSDRGSSSRFSSSRDSGGRDSGSSFSGSRGSSSPSSGSSGVSREEALARLKAQRDRERQ